MAGTVTAAPGGGRVRILAVADLHYRLRQFDWLLATASSVDAVIIAGDLLDVRSPVALDVQAVAVQAALRRLVEVTVLFAASGNHDLDGRMRRGSGRRAG
jgi:DNA repair exonuclease SbcCD nuclease subunit